MSTPQVDRKLVCGKGFRGGGDRRSGLGEESLERAPRKKATGNRHAGVDACSGAALSCCGRGVGRNVAAASYARDGAAAVDNGKGPKGGEAAHDAGH